MKDNRKCYIIAEAGQNHNGQMDMAKQLIDMVGMPIFDKAFDIELPKVNAVKFTKRDMSEELSRDAYNKVYDSPNAFGKTYGEHREKLELSYEQHEELFHYANDRKIDFIETFTSPKTLQLLEKIDVKYIKVASRDLTNIPLLDEIGKSGKPVILSTGMGGLEEIDKAVETINRYHEDIVILHCVSQYPAEYHNLSLKTIPFLKERYKYQIGYSDHSIGIVVPVVAFSMGADFIEKHITLSHSLKGSDHKGALEPEGLWRMVRDIRNIEKSMGDYSKWVPEGVSAAKSKLERSLATAVEIKQGTTVTAEMLTMLSPGNGMQWDEKELVVGKKAASDIPALKLISKDMFE